MNHLFLCREYPPAPYPAGGIGSYVSHITRLLAEHGETVHVIGQRWEGAHRQTEQFCNGRLIIHRIAVEDTGLYPTLMQSAVAAREMKAMQASSFPAQWFSWVAAGLIEKLIESEGIDVIEAQEWEAPLYYFMLRRSLGLGPARTPPVITHIHSPTEFIFRSNDWSPARPDYLPMKRLEDHVILGADALLCPSLFLASQIRTKFGLSSKAVTTIPLPLGDTTRIERPISTWRDGSVCYFGRLEPRKGIIEFVDAAVEVAQENAEVRFSFIGSDTPFNESISVRQHVQRRIPAAMRERFVFYGPRPRPELLTMLGEARIAVVPSRWENFPNTVLEAMCTGLPVLATRNGGMTEMIVDGESGWLTEDGPGPLTAQLANSLRRALETSPERLKAMGDRASASIRQLCDNDAIVSQHLDFRRECAAAGADLSLAPPRNLPWSEQTGRPVPTPSAQPSDGAIVAVVIALADEDATPALDGLSRQMLSHTTLLVATDPTTDINIRFLQFRGSATAAARKLALDSTELKDAKAVLFLQAATRLEPSALTLMAAALDNRAEAGIIVPWTDAGASITGETPAFPYQWMSDETGWACLYRMTAVRAALALDPDAAETWELGAAIMAAGWSALRMPAMLATNHHQPAVARDILWSQRRLAERHSTLIAQDLASLLTIVPTAESSTDAKGLRREQVDSIAIVMQMSLQEKFKLAVAAARQPRNSLRWLSWRVRSGFGQIYSKDKP